MHSFARLISLLLIGVLLAACNSAAAPTAIPLSPSSPGSTAISNLPTSQPAATAISTTQATPDPRLSAATLAPLEIALPAGLRLSESGSFASYQLPPVESSATLNSPPIAADLGNVELTVMLSAQQRAGLAANGFVVSPSSTREFYELYERARYDNIPVFVSSDSLLHVYHLLFDKTLRQAETRAFIPLLSRLDFAMLETSLTQYQALAGSPWAEAARHNAAYFALAVKLLNPDWPVPEGLRDLVEPDLARIAAHDRIAPSAIFPGYLRGEDWSQYLPRGHYTKSPELERYFRAMIWHGRMTFRAQDALETRQAALLTLAFEQTRIDGTPAAALWEAIYEPTVFFVGRSDDLTPQEYSSALQAAYGPLEDPRELIDETGFQAFQQQIELLRPPEILGMLVLPGQELEVSKGLRFMGQRFVPDAFVFQQLIDPRVPERGLPSSLDFFAALGSTRALAHLEASGATQLPKYLPNLQELQAQFAGYDEAIWTQNLYWSWIYSLRPLLEPVDSGYPQFMRSQAWLDKQLTTALSSWTELKRDTILYAKQVYAERGYDALQPPEPERPKGYVEPVPLLYARVAALTGMTIAGLQQRGLLSPEDQAALEAMQRIALRLQSMAETQLRGQALSAEDYEFIRFYGAEIEALTFAASDESSYQGRGGFPAGGEPLQAAVVADIATNAGMGLVLENGVGRVFEIYAIVPIEGRLVLTLGGVFSHYEFTQPLGERLTDEAWRAMLDNGAAPALASWTSSYLVEQHAGGVLESAIRRFNEQLIQTVWFTTADPVAPLLGPAELADTQAYLDELRAANQFIGSKLLSLQFLSFDYQDDANAVVTTRERWTEELYRGSPYFEDQQSQGEPQRIGVRPPYEVVVTYTLQRQGEQWLITRIVLAPENLPDWQS